MSARDKLLKQVLEMCKKKLNIYRDHSDGQYHGGIEHTKLISNIDAAIFVLGKHETNS